MPSRYFGNICRNLSCFASNTHTHSLPHSPFSLLCRRDESGLRQGECRGRQEREHSMSGRDRAFAGGHARVEDSVHNNRSVRQSHSAAPQSEGEYHRAVILEFIRPQAAPLGPPLRCVPLNILPDNRTKNRSRSRRRSC